MMAFLIKGIREADQIEVYFIKIEVTGLIVRMDSLSISIEYGSN
jgi:hypothetical protein